MLVVFFPITNGCADILVPTCEGIHTQNCCILQKVNPDDYYMRDNAKEKFLYGNQENENKKENCNPNIAESSASASLVKKPAQHTFAKKAMVCTYVTEEMKARIDELATMSMKRSTLPPK